jgi:hypothetical protein
MKSLDKSSFDILIDLDCMIDTRLSTLINNFPTLTAKLVTEKKYHSRTSDDYLCIDHRVFYKLYDKRDNENIRIPIRTNILPILNEYCCDVKKDMYMKQEDMLTVYVNTYPYILDYNEEELIKFGLMNRLPSGVNVEIVSMSNVTPRWLDENVRAFMTYDGMRWLNKQVAKGNFIGYSIPNVTLITPALFNGGLPEDVDGVLEETRESLSLYIGINFVTVEFFLGEL